MRSASSPGHVRIVLAVQQPHRTVERDRCMQQQPGASVLDQRAGDGIGLAVLAWPVQDTVAHEGGALLDGHRLPHQRLGEVGRGGDTDQRGDAIRTGERGEQRDPAAHRRADQDQRSLGQPVDHGERIVGPAADGAVLEPAAAGTVAGVVEAQHGLAAFGAERGERGRLVAGHVAAEAGEEHDRGTSALLPCPGQFDPIAAIEPSGAWHGVRSRRTASPARA